jgi:hypothetical protein
MAQMTKQMRPQTSDAQLVNNLKEHNKAARNQTDIHFNLNSTQANRVTQG